MRHSIFTLTMWGLWFFIARDDADKRLTRFEKSLYDLIRGLRNNRGNEVEYIQNSLKECKVEIKSQDMGSQSSLFSSPLPQTIRPMTDFRADKKTTALLKLIYLEMFGYDMSWASFHVLEVMSSAKYLQKRVGYLAAAQSFRADTEVLMLATNLLKKVCWIYHVSAIPSSSDECIGHCFFFCSKSFAAACNAATHYHTFSCYVLTFRYSTAPLTFECNRSKENGRQSL